MTSIYEEAGGLDMLVKLAKAWHERVLADEVVSHAFRNGVRADHSERLASYWAQALGGPEYYTGHYGDETQVVRLHSGDGEHDDMDRRALDCFDAALADVGLEGRTAAALHAYFTHALRTMSSFPRSEGDVPEGLPFPSWSWDGPADRPSGGHAG